MISMVKWVLNYLVLLAVATDIVLAVCAIILLQILHLLVFIIFMPVGQSARIFLIKRILKFNLTFTLDWRNFYHPLIY